jgi:23S rRNA (pseudouridine1915-N3)-methyltransferase
VKIRILWVGKTREEWLKTGMEEYETRLRRYFPVEICEAREEKGGNPELMREREGERLEKLLPKNGRLVLLDETGESLTSPQFAGLVGKYRDTAAPEVVFAVGGAYGFSAGFRARADRTVSLSRMTFTHQMVRLILLEQLYRACTILNGEPYHH